jgi:penicillin-binding protein-related factor A (putative recombinase)
MSETLFEGLFAPYGKRAYLHKITDTKEVTGLNGRPTKTKKEPSDYIVTFDGIMFYAEVKGSQNETSFPFGNIQPGQLGASRRQLAAGGHYFFYILRNKTGHWHKVPADVIHNCPKQSMTWAELAPYRI